ncbi:MAG TPA: response regulator [Steroidobacteraceae bacterium]|nr:response regulator [Steroidobacteraceae bacterium]
MKSESEAVRVLLVEDSPIVAERVKESIREIPGVTVVDTLDRESAAVDTLARGGIDVVILDLHLNRGTGFGVLRALPRLERPRPVIIIFTSYDLPEYRRQAMALGADHFLDKAQDFERIPQLLQTIREERQGGPPPTMQ